MAEIAILGFGIVGSGVWEVLERNQSRIEQKSGEPVRVKKVLDIREIPELGDTLTHSMADILGDRDISIVVEVMGGVKPAYTFVRDAMSCGKSVITSNKELVAAHGPELVALAKKQGVSFLFEASVGGGIPIIKNFEQSLSTDEVLGFAGILNGTTNYILTSMSVHRVSFEDALAEAQRLGYAERDPSADVDGHDSCRKLAILMSLGTGRHVDSRLIHTEGITGITGSDFAAACAMNSVIKLLAVGLVKEGKAVVAPFVVRNTHPLSIVSGVYNALEITGGCTGRTMSYGMGAGKLPTAAAVVTDIVEAIKHSGHPSHLRWQEDSGRGMLPQPEYRRLLRLDCKKASRERRIAELKAYFGEDEAVWLDSPEDELYVIAPKGRDMSGIKGQKSAIRLYEEG